MSKTKLKHASYSIKKLMDKSELSFQAKNNYQEILKLCTKQLDSLGYQIDDIEQLKQKHVYALVEYWKDKYLSNATIMNRMSTLRYACSLMKKANVVLANNHYEICHRSYIPKTSKAIKEVDFNKIEDAFIRQSLKLQQQFGLRREESIKFISSIADKGDHIELQASWTKGGIQRVIPITTADQRQCLDQAKRISADGSLIPKNKSFIEQRMLYDNVTHKANLYNLHGLRHAYAQNRYFALTSQFTDGKGWYSPLDGGKPRKELNDYEKSIDLKTREIISRELGHSRVEITKIYLG